MSKETLEHLSALVDGEISRETSRFLVKRLGNDVELRSTWARYHLVRDCLRHQDGSIAGDDLCSRISSVLEQEQPRKPSRSIPTGWLKPAAGLAIAASVALMAVVAVGPGTSGSPQGTGELAEQSTAEPFTSPQSLIPAPSSRQASLSTGAGSADQKMNSYLLRHYQATRATSDKGFVTFVPIVITRARIADETANAGSDGSSETGRDEDSELR